MSAPVSRLQEQNETAQLAAHFNEFYLQITSPSTFQVGNYRILKEIGEGAFGKVYLAEHVLLHSQVVLKCGLLEDPNIVREIYYHKQLRHRNIVKLYEVIKTETQLWMVLEYCEGNELYYHIYEKRRLDIITCKNIFYQIVEAMRYVHSLNLAHRDLKLENILMADEEKTVVKLTDFGFVREFNPYKRSFLSTMCGTTSYMAPEVLKNEKYSGFAIDVWSMGVILYAMAYGQLPFDEDDDMKTKLKIINDEPSYQEFASRDLNTLLQQMLSKDPSRRPTISEILNSSFLIDITNLRTQRRNSAATDTESIVSINQYYNVHTTPFQSRMEKDLLKKLRKGNIDIESLVASKLNGNANALTAFYDLSLKVEFEKQKRRQLRRKRYYEAKRQLKRSKKRVKSVLSLSDQISEGQPLEKILTSLSIASNKNDYSPSGSNMTRKSSENFTRASVQPQRKVSYSKTIGINSSLENRPKNAVPAPLERSVSFYTDDQKSTNASYHQELGPKGKSKQILEKLQFWKKSKQRDGESGTIEPASSISQTSSGRASNTSDPGGLELNVSRNSALAEGGISNNPDVSAGDILDCQEEPDKSNVSIENSTITADAISQLQSTSERGIMAKRQRPDSVISQYSQYSHASQLYTMSESELDIMDGTDLEDDYYDDDAAYDSSISVTQNEYLQRPASYTSSSRSKRRPPNFRIPSDTSIMSSSTSATRKKNPLSQVSSNSSDDSSAIIKLAERLDDGASNSNTLPRPISPRQEFGRSSSLKKRGSRSTLAKSAASNGQMIAPTPVLPQKREGEISRSLSPPIGNKSSHKINGVGKYRSSVLNSDSTGSNGKSASHFPKGLLKMPSADSHTWRRDSPIAVPTSNVFEGKFISINEEEEDAEEDNC